jgi:hypothetical protein
MNTKIPLLGAVLIVIVIISGCTQTGQVTTTPTDTNTDMHLTSEIQQPTCRDVQEPYTIQVPYQDTEIYTVYLDAYVVDAEKTWRLDLEGNFAVGIVQLKNIDNEAGWFTVNFKWETLNDDYTDSIRHYIEPDETVEFRSDYAVNIGEDNQFTYTYRSDSVQRTRTVTKYRTETRYRTVQVCD